MKQNWKLTLLILALSTAIGCSDSDDSVNVTPAPATATPTVAPTATPTEGGGAQCFEPTLSGSECDPEEVEFTLDSINPYYPLFVGMKIVLEGEEDGEVVRVERVVLEETEVVAGVETHVLEHREYVDGEIEEIARNFYVETEDGTVCYFGEDVENYEDGELSDTDGSWRAGIDGAEPGIIMPADPAVGDSYFQENAPGIAVDMGMVSAVGVSRTIGGTAYQDVVVVQDSDPLDDCEDEEEKVYVPGLGEVIDDVLELVSVEIPQCYEPTLDEAACDPAAVDFTLDSTNPYYPLVVGLEVILEGEEDGETVRVERVVLDETEVVAGVETRVLEHKEFIDDEIHEVARNFYVETTGGTVCYFGEDVEFYEDGELVDMHGSWRAGVNGALPGIIMPANPTVGDSYFQESAPGAADMGRVAEVGVSRTVGGVDYDDVVVIEDSNPLEIDGCEEEEEKVYAPGVGEIVDDFLELVDE